MFKQAFRLAFVALIWKQYKAAIISTLLLIAYLILVSNVHADYVAHLELKDQAASAGLSFVFKWLAYAAGIAVYFLFFWWRALKTRKLSKTDKQRIAEITAAEKNSDHDPFAEIRQRKTLRSRADFMEEKE